MSSLTWPLSRKMLANLNQQERQLLADKLMDPVSLSRQGQLEIREMPNLWD